MSTDEGQTLDLDALLSMERKLERPEAVLRAVRQSRARTFLKIDDWAERMRENVPAQPGSALHTADTLSDPYPASQAVSYLLMTATDHLHAVRSLFEGANLQHLRAPYTLIRGALESATLALYISRDPAPRAIAREALRLQSWNLIDSERALATARGPADMLDSRKRRLREVAGELGVLGAVFGSPPSTSTIFDRVAESYRLHETSKLAWHVCSAAAHGKSWASLILSNFEINERRDGVVTGTFTSDEVLIGAVLDTACSLMDRATTVQDRLSRPAGHTGRSFFSR